MNSEEIVRTLAGLYRRFEVRNSAGKNPQNRREGLVQYAEDEQHFADEALRAHELSAYTAAVEAFGDVPVLSIAVGANPTAADLATVEFRLRLRDARMALSVLQGHQVVPAAEVAAKRARGYRL